MARKYSSGKKTPCGRRKSVSARMNKVRARIRSTNLNMQLCASDSMVSDHIASNSNMHDVTPSHQSTDVKKQSPQEIYTMDDSAASVSSISRQTCSIERVEANVTGEKILSNDMSGRRVVDVQHFFNEIISFKHLELFNCKNEYLQLIKEKRKGFISNFTIICSCCKESKQICTESYGADMDINIAAVMGTISTGGSFSQLQETFGYCNIPTMNGHQFQDVQNQLAKVIHDITWSVLEEAGKEERRIAITKGDVDDDGIPFITVIADGAWSKRSYKVNYDAKSGVGVIIGEATKKILFIGVRNKYCSVCMRSETKKAEVPQHKCFKNWDKPSTGMESDIIVEGFLKSVELHGVKYGFLIGDGDSSVLKKLTECRPYKNRSIQEIECINHLLRNYCTRLRDLLTKKVSSKKENVSIKQRNALKNNIRRLRWGILGAVKHINENCTHLSHREKIQQLKIDIKNGPYHVFGYHNNCNKYFCTGAKINEVNWIPEMTESGLLNDILFVTERLVLNAESLLINMNNNAAEQYNAVVAKFVGGKRINFTMRGSYQARCEAAALSFNILPGQLPRYINKQVTGRSPGTHIKKIILSKAKNRMWKKCRKTLFPSSRMTNNKFSSCTDADEDYGIPLIEDMTEEEFEREKEIFLRSLSKTPDEIALLQSETIGQANTLLWREERRKRLTASMFGRICKLRKTTHCANTVKSMLYSTFKGSIATDWGKEHEAIALKEYSLKQNIEIKECGLFIDVNKPYLGASPDGLVGEQGILEVKCPKKASQYTPIEAILNKNIKFAKIQNGNIFLKRNHVYYFQVQGQLQITQRSYCLFIIWTPLGIESEVIHRDDIFWKENMIDKLTDFYFNCMLPEIINPQYPQKKIKDLRITD